MKYMQMWMFLIARESKSISEHISSQLAYEKYNYAQRNNIGQSCQMPLSHLWWLQCVCDGCGTPGWSGNGSACGF